MSEPSGQQTRYTLIDLAEVIESLGDHYRRTERDLYGAACECGEIVYQDEDACQFCGRNVVWRNSKRWALLFGKPEDAIRRLTIVPPTEETGRALCDVARVAGFANVSQAKRWLSLVKKVGRDEAMNVVRYVALKHPTGRGVFAHAFNLMEKIAREREGPQEPASETQERADTIRQALAGRTVGSD